MMKKNFNIVFNTILLISIICTGGFTFSHGQTIDKEATPETKALFLNLRSLAGKSILFGHQDATKYGIGWSGDADRSDVKSVTSSHPALFGWDLEGIGSERPIDERRAEALHTRQVILDAYKSGGVSTLSWHVQNFRTGRNFYDTTVCLPDILPGKELHDKYLRSLDQIAEFIASLKTEDGIAIPVIFRPFHEHNGNWFWWCKPFCSPEEYKQLWHFTVSYLRDQKGLHNILYAYSPDRIYGNFDDYLERYPGDEWVDILGFDNYRDFSDMDNTRQVSVGIRSLALIAEYASDHGKIVALTETGLGKITQPQWFTKLLAAILEDPLASRISYLQVWRNAHEGHHYAPYPGHAAADDFLKFYQHPATMFLNDLGETLYQTNQKQETEK